MATIAENEVAARKVRVFGPDDFPISQLTFQALGVKSMLRDAKANLQDWNSDLQQVCYAIYIARSSPVILYQLKIERKPGEAALFAMTQNVSARLDVRSRRSELYYPPLLIRRAALISDMPYKAIYRMVF